MFRPETFTERREELEQLGGLDRFDHHGDGKPEHLGEPEAGPLPTAEVGHHQDRTETSSAHRDLAHAVESKAGIDLGRR